MKNKTKQISELAVFAKCVKTYPQQEFFVESFLDIKTGEEYKFRNRKSYKTGMKYKQIPVKLGADQTFDPEGKILRCWKKQEQ
jgi:hypothetical protein